MFREKLEDAIRLYLDATLEFERCEEELRTLHEPEKKTEFLSIDELEEYTEERNAFCNRYSTLNNRAHNLRQQRKNAERSICARIPRETWLKFGDVGIGVAYSDWGGEGSFVVVKPWVEGRMPSLDRRHRGD